MSNKFINVKTMHIIGWIAYLAFLIFFFSSMLSFKIAIFRALQMAMLHAIVFYFNSFVLMPRLMDKRKYTYYFLSLIVLIIAALSILYILDFQLKPMGNFFPEGRDVKRIFNNELRDIHDGKRQMDSVLLWRSTMRNFSSIFAIILVSIVYRMFYQKILDEKREVALRNENLLSEMKFLKSQINPHFLFNALNNIYTLVHLKQDSAAVMLMKLSDMLRYMLYECNDEWVPLKKEISYINNYIELQQLKTEQTQNIVTNFYETVEGTLIPPLLLIPFVENSFKHSRIIDIEKGWITMQLSSSEELIQFKITNNIPSVPMAKDATEGIGLENVKRRLDLLYPDKYELKIDKTATEYSVELNLF